MHFCTFYKHKQVTNLTYPSLVKIFQAKGIYFFIGNVDKYLPKLLLDNHFKERTDTLID